MDLRELFKFSNNKNELEDSGIESILPKPQIHGVKCTACTTVVNEEELASSLYVCPVCKTYLSIRARDRILMLADKGSFVEHDKTVTPENKLDFPGYTEKIEVSQKNSGEKEAVITGTITIAKYRCAIFSMESKFMMGSMGSVVGDKITRLFEYATAEGIPVIGVTVSGGARMQEGMISLMQMAKVSGAVKRHSDAGLLYTVLLTNPTTGGVTASFAMLGDIILAEPKALVGFAGPRVIEQTIRKKLPEGFQSAESLLKCGFIDAIVARSDQRPFFARLLRLHGCKKEDNQ